jgi:hypothetical protein
MRPSSSAWRQHKDQGDRPQTAARELTIPVPRIAGADASRSEAGEGLAEPPEGQRSAQPACRFQGTKPPAIVCGVPEFIREISTDNVREDRYGREYCK